MNSTNSPVLNRHSGNPCVLEQHNVTYFDFSRRRKTPPHGGAKILPWPVGTTSDIVHLPSGHQRKLYASNMLNMIDFVHQLNKHYELGQISQIPRTAAKLALAAEAINAHQIALLATDVGEAAMSHISLPLDKNILKINELMENLATKTLPRL